MTEIERAFIRKEFESRTVFQTTQTRDAFMNAYINARRKKNASFVDLYKKKQEKADKEYNNNAIRIIEEMEEKQGKSWIDKIYNASGMKRPKR